MTARRHLRLVTVGDLQDRSQAVRGDADTPPEELAAQAVERRGGTAQEAAAAWVAVASGGILDEIHEADELAAWALHEHFGHAGNPSTEGCDCLELARLVVDALAAQDLICAHGREDGYDGAEIDFPDITES
jgi:hypothetical protein